MLTLRKASDRFFTQTDWLKSWHSFSFGHHYDPSHMGFGPLRVINEDIVAGHGGFPTHPHQDMEIITVVLSGALEHRDSLGTGSIIKPGDVQKMSAGTGIRHSEFNASPSEPVHLLQIWIIPDREGVTPGYQQQRFTDTQGRFRLIASPDGAEGSISLYQDVRLYRADLTQGEVLNYTVEGNRDIWMQAASGSFQLNGESLEAGDGIAGHNETGLTLTAKKDGAVLLFDMPA